MVGETIVMSIELMGGTTLVLTIGALTAAASKLRTWIASRNPQGLRPVQEAAQPIAQMRARIDPYRDPAGDSLLAKALGISREELSQARQQAHNRILSQLLNEGLRYEALASSGPQGDDAPTRRGFQGIIDAGPEQSGDETAFLAFLAESLEITLGNLQQARESALELALTRAVEDGIMTEELVGDQLMRYRAQAYLDPSALLSEALDSTLEEIEDRPLDAWLNYRRLTWRALTARLAAAREDALAQAVTDGALNRSEADRLLKESTWTPLIDSRTTLQLSAKELPAYGFLYLRGAEGRLN